MVVKGMKRGLRCIVCDGPIPKNKNGRYATCGQEACVAAWRRDRRLRSTYGITAADWDRMFEEQGGRCALCRRKSKLGLAVEHSHLTGTVRGLACMTCNRDILGFLDKDPQHLRDAIAFLQRVLEDRLTYTSLED